MSSGGPGGGAGLEAGKLVKVLVGELGRSGGRGRRGPTGGKAAPPVEVAERTFAWSAQGPQPAAQEPGGEPGPALTLSLSPDDAQAVREGRLAPSVAFMQGRLKTSGDNALLLDVLAWTATPGAEGRAEALAPSGS